MQRYIILLQFSRFRLCLYSCWLRHTVSRRHAWHSDQSQQERGCPMRWFLIHPALQDHTSWLSSQSALSSPLRCSVLSVKAWSRGEQTARQVLSIATGRRFPMFGMCCEAEVARISQTAEHRTQSHYGLDQTIPLSRFACINKSQQCLFWRTLNLRPKHKGWFEDSRCGWLRGVAWKLKDWKPIGDCSTH